MKLHALCRRGRRLIIRFHFRFHLPARWRYHAARASSQTYASAYFTLRHERALDENADAVGRSRHDGVPCSGVSLRADADNLLADDVAASLRPLSYTSCRYASPASRAAHSFDFGSAFINGREAKSRDTRRRAAIGDFSISQYADTPDDAARVRARAAAHTRRHASSRTRRFRIRCKIFTLLAAVMRDVGPLIALFGRMPGRGLSLPHSSSIHICH